MARAGAQASGDHDPWRLGCRHILQQAVTIAKGHVLPPQAPTLACAGVQQLDINEPLRQTAPLTASVHGNGAANGARNSRKPFQTVETSSGSLAGQSR